MTADQLAEEIAADIYFELADDLPVTLGHEARIARIIADGIKTLAGKASSYDRLMEINDTIGRIADDDG